MTDQTPQDQQPEPQPAFMPGWVPGAGPQPVPVAFKWHVATAPDGESRMVLELLSPLGQQFWFFTTDGVTELVRQAQEKIPEARSGLVIAGAGTVPTFGMNGHGG